MRVRIAPYVAADARRARGGSGGSGLTRQSVTTGPSAPASQIPKTGKGKKGSQPVNRDRFISKMFLRGDSVILVLRNPK